MSGASKHFEDAYRSAGLDEGSENGQSLTGITDITKVSRELPAPTPFPVDALPKPCRRLVGEAAASIGCPSEFVGLPMLVTLGSAIGNSRRLKLKAGWDEGAAIYATVIADPGEKKTPAYKVAVEPARKRQAVLKEEYLKKREEYQQELREYEVEKRTAAKDGFAAPPPPEPPVLERTLVEDITIEALASVLEHNMRGVLVVRDELVAWVRSMDQYRASGRGADRQFWLSAWSNSYASVDRKGRPEPLILQVPFVGVFGSIQPSVLPELGQGREDGLLDRLLVAFPEPLPSRWTDDEITVGAREGVRQLYEKLRKLHMPEDDHGDPAPAPVVLSPDAKTVMVDLINSHRVEMERPGFPARLKGPWSKLEAYLARLSLILAMCRAVTDETSERVEAQDVLMAQSLLNYFKNHARRVYVGLYGETPDDRLAEDVASFLENRGGFWEGQPAELHEQLESDFKPRRANELTKRLRAIASYAPGLAVEVGERWMPELKNKRRFIALRLRNVGNLGNVGKEGDQ